MPLMLRKFLLSTDKMRVHNMYLSPEIRGQSKQRSYYSKLWYKFHPFVQFRLTGSGSINFIYFIYVAAEVVKTIGGSFGLVTVATFTALMGGLILAPSPIGQ